MYPDATSIVGKEFDGYRIEGVLGRGGMGIVYKAENQSLGRTVALKVIVPDLAQNEVFLKRFRREARALAQFYQGLFPSCPAHWFYDLLPFLP